MKTVGLHGDLSRWVLFRLRFPVFENCHDFVEMVYISYMLNKEKDENKYK